jgi:hypothetical protein
MHPNHPFSYYTEGELEIEDEALKRLFNGYDPGREFIVVLLNADCKAVYRGDRPEIGWMGNPRTKNHYRPFGSSRESQEVNTQ